MELHHHQRHHPPNGCIIPARALTAAEWQKFAADQRRKNGIRGAAQLFPWLLDGAPAERVQAVLKRFPPPLRVVYRRIWRPRYARHNHWEPSTQSPRS